MILATFFPDVLCDYLYKCIELHPSSRGLLPALLIEDEAAGRREVVTESDVLLERLEGLFGPLGVKMNGAEARRKRGLERQLFGAWCDWLCRPSRSAKEEGRKREQFRYW